MSFRIQNRWGDLTDTEPGLQSALGPPSASVKPQLAGRRLRLVSSAKRAVEGDLLQATFENRELLIVQSRDE